MNIPQRLKTQSNEQLAQRVMQLEDALVKCNAERNDLNAAFNSLSDAVYNRREVAAAVQAEREAILAQADDLEFKPSKWSDLLAAIRARAKLSSSV